MNVDLEPYIYRPHPIYRLPSREDAAVACRTKAGEKEFRDAMYQRGMRIRNEVVDPFRYGHEPDHWKTADRLLDESDELLIRGRKHNRPNRCAKTAKSHIPTERHQKASQGLNPM